MSSQYQVKQSFPPGPWFQTSTTGKSNSGRGNKSGKYDRRGNSRPPEFRGLSRISSICGRLRTIEARRRTGRYRLLVDSGAAINIIKEEILDDQDERNPTYKTFLMGNDRHISKQSTKLKFFDQEHIFHIVPNDFPLPEGGIIGIKFIEKYPRYAITNKYLVVDKVKLPLYLSNDFIPGNSEKICTISTDDEDQHIIIIDNEEIPDGPYAIRNGQIKIPMKNNEKYPKEINPKMN